MLDTIQPFQIPGAAGAAITAPGCLNVTRVISLARVFLIPLVILCVCGRQAQRLQQDREGLPILGAAAVSEALRCLGHQGLLLVQRPLPPVLNSKVLFLSTRRGGPGLCKSVPGGTGTGGTPLGAQPSFSKAWARAGGLQQRADRGRSLQPLPTGSSL